MEGRICVVTGANSGIGKALAGQLGTRGATVVLVARNEQRGTAALSELQKRNPGARYELVLGDLSSMEQVRKVAADIRARHPRLDVLVNNAGIYLPNRQVTPDGFEYMLAVNHLAAFLLTHELLDRLAPQASAPSRVITVSSFGHHLGHIDFEDLQAERNFNGLRQYCNTKLANILFTRELARRVRDRNIVAHCFHPGSVATGFAQDEFGWFAAVMKLGKPFLRSAEKAARTGAHLALSDDALQSTGDYWVNSRRKKPSSEARSDEAALRLWDVSERLLRLKA